MNKEKAIFLVDTGAEVSLISLSTPGLVINDSQVSPVSITHQPSSWRSGSKIGAGWCSNKMEFPRG